jgi:hypothetical protein
MRLGSAGADTLVAFQNGSFAIGGCGLQISRISGIQAGGES